MTLNKDLIKRIIEEYGDAFYILDSKQFELNFNELKEVFSLIYSNFNIAYSYKTNYIPKLCSIVNKHNGYAEVVSEMELELAKRIGVENRNVIWNGPIKNIDIVKDFLFDGGCVNIDSYDEFLKVLELSKEKTINIGLRCNFDVGDGIISRFGFDINDDEFKETIRLIKENRNICLKSIQCHFAKRQIEYWPKRIEGILNLIDNYNIKPERIDVGGGMFGKMDERLERQFNYRIPTYLDYANVVAKAFKDKFDGDYKPELVIEPGTALVGDCMKFIGKIESIKKVRGKCFATVLASQKNISMTNINPPIDIISMGNKQEEYDDVDFVGYTCIEGDVLYRNYSGKLAIGDVLVINNCGSYSIVMKPPFILPNFPIIDIVDNKITLIKRKESFEDIFNSYSLEG